MTLVNLMSGDFQRFDLLLRRPENNLSSSVEILFNIIVIMKPVVTKPLT
jgi:hypothetical protein